MSSYQRKTADPLNVYNPWVVAVHHGSLRRPATTARSEANAANVIMRALRRMRSALRYPPAR